MNSPGRIVPREPASLKAAYSDLVDACGGDDKAGVLAQKSGTQMHRYTDPGEPECHMPLIVVMALEAHCGEPHVTRFMALQTQHVLVSTGEGYSDAIAVHMGKIGQDTGSLYKQFADAIADGTLSRKEIARLLAAAFKDLNSIAALIGDLWRMQRGEG
jgi:hypothetical protein